MKKPVLIAAGLLLVLRAGSARAYDQYSLDGGATNCGLCHGGFKSNYISKTDGQHWGNLHNLHRNAMLGGDCNACHGSTTFPVSPNSSLGGNGLSNLSCVGCHGRTRDHNPANPDSANGWSGYGAGLRQHHHNAGVTVCSGCHLDANPASYTPVAEYVLPDYYANPGTAHPGMPADSCNPAGTEDFAGIINGLDNDGDGFYDTNDPDCASVPDLSVTPFSIDFGNINNGASSLPQIVTINSTGTAILNATDISLSGADAAEFALDTGDGTGGTCGTPPLTLAPLANCTVSTAFSPVNTGTMSASLEIDSNRGNIRVPLNGLGLSAALNTPPSAPELVRPANGSTVAGPDVTFEWNRSTDPDGNPVTYGLYICNTPSFAVCNTPENTSPIASAHQNRAVYFAGGMGIGIVFLGLALAGGMGRRRALAIVLALLALAGALVLSCGGGGGGTPPPPVVPPGEVAYDMAGLTNSTLYYWKVEASDGTATAESATWSFTTQ